MAYMKHTDYLRYSDRYVRSSGFPPLNPTPIRAGTHFDIQRFKALDMGYKGQLCVKKYPVL